MNWMMSYDCHHLDTRTEVLFPQEEYQKPHSLTGTETLSMCSVFSKIFAGLLVKKSSPCSESPHIGLN